MKTQVFWILCLLLVVTCRPVQASQPSASSPLPAMLQPSFHQSGSESHHQAIELARSQHFSEALGILSQLHEEQPDDLPVAYDYITVLNWAGDHPAAVFVYETLPASQAPAYVLKSAGGSYFQLGQYQKAYSLYQQLAAKGDAQAKLWQAECLAQLGDVPGAQALYQAILLDNPHDASAYLSRAGFYSRQHQYPLAIADLEQILQALPSEATQAQVREIQAALAAAHINHNQPDLALTILKPYVASHSATPSMQGNYVLALRSSGQFQQAVQASDQFWPDRAAAPLFALKASAEAWIQLNQPQQAIQVYRHLLTRQPQDDSARLGLACAYLLAGQTDDGLSLYEQLLTAHPDYSAQLERDAVFLFANQQPHAGKVLFELLLRHFPNQPELREQYAAALRQDGQPRAAFRQYRQLPATTAGLTGMIKTAAAVEDYRQTAGALQQLRTLAPAPATLLPLEGLYDQRRLGQITAAFGSNGSYKEVQSRYWELNAEQNIGGNSWLLAGTNQTRLKDLSTTENRTLTSHRIGFRSQDIDKTLSLSYLHYDHLQQAAGYSLAGDWYLRDNTTLSLSVDRTPLLDVQALTGQAGKPILETAYRLNFFRILNTREDFTIALDRSLLSDGNQTAGFQLNHTYTLYDRDKQSLNRLLYWNRHSFSKQGLVYESPELRESLGLGYVYRHELAGGTLTNRLLLNWEHDAPDPLAFNPTFRIEYSREVSATHSLSVGFEYGLRSDHLTGRDLRYSYRQIDGLYRISW